jgi:pimeloyl-ACP methyl ester carboxylesterase
VATAWASWFRRSCRYLEGIPQPALVVNGSNDIVIPTFSYYMLQQILPNAELILFSDSNHGSHFQFTERFTRYATDFVDR